MLVTAKLLHLALRARGSCFSGSPKRRSRSRSGLCDQGDCETFEAGMEVFEENQGRRFGCLRLQKEKVGLVKIEPDYKP